MLYNQGVSEGVFYEEDGTPHAWNGLVNVIEKPENSTLMEAFNCCNKKYYARGHAVRSKFSIVCHHYPKIMREYMGYRWDSRRHIYLGNQPYRPFHFSYRTETEPGEFAVHLILNQMMSVGEVNRGSITSSPRPTTYTLNTEGAQYEALGTDHIILPSGRSIPQAVLDSLYGTDTQAGDLNRTLSMIEDIVISGAASLKIVGATATMFSLHGPNDILEDKGATYELDSSYVSLDGEAMTITDDD